MTFDITAIIVVVIHIAWTKVPKFETSRHLIMVVEFVNGSVSAGGCSDVATKVNRAHEFVMSPAPSGL